MCFTVIDDAPITTGDIRHDGGHNRGHLTQWGASWGVTPLPNLHNL